jgi:hypothetical protein
MNRSAIAPLEKHIDNAIHGRRMWDASCRMCAGMHKRRGSTLSATGGLSDVASGVRYAPAHTYNSAPGKMILDQSVEALPVRCSSIRDRPAATCKSCGRRFVVTAEDAQVTSYIGVKSRFPQLGVWLNNEGSFKEGFPFTLWSIYGVCSLCYSYIAIKVSREMHCNVDIYSTRQHLLVIMISFTFLEYPA